MTSICKVLTVCIRQWFQGHCKHVFPVSREHAGGTGNSSLQRYRGALICRVTGRSAGMFKLQCCSGRNSATSLVSAGICSNAGLFSPCCQVAMGSFYIPVLFVWSVKSLLYIGVSLNILGLFPDHHRQMTQVSSAAISTCFTLMCSGMFPNRSVFSCGNLPCVDAMLNFCSPGTQLLVVISLKYNTAWEVINLETRKGKKQTDREKVSE